MGMHLLLHFHTQRTSHTHTNGRAAAAIQDAAAFSIMDKCLAQGHFDTLTVGIQPDANLSVFG